MGIFDKSSSGPGGSSPHASDPLDLRPIPVGAPRMPEGISENAYTWHNAHLLVTQAQAGNWFGDSSTCAEVARACHPQVEELMLQVAPHLATWQLHPEFILDQRFRGRLRRDPMRDTRVPLQGSPEGRRVTAVLAQLGVTMTATPTGDLIGTWPTHFGTPFVQCCALFSTSSGERYVYWHTTVLVSNRPVVPQVGPEDDLQICVAVPEFLQTAAYLAETPFPGSSLVSFDRTRTLAKEESGTLPTPVAVRRDLAKCMVRTSETRVQEAGVGTRVDLGHVCPMSCDEAELRRAIAIAADAGMHFQTIVEDGYRNYSRQDNIAFQQNLLAEVGFGDDDQRWIASVALPELIEKAADLMQRRSTEPAQAAAIDDALVRQVVGLPFVWAVNNLVFHHLVPAKAYDDAVALLDVATALNEGNESLNAQSNRALVEYELGDRTVAEQMFRGLLDLGNDYLEAEPRYHLGLIARDRGNLPEARTQFQWILDHPSSSVYMDPAREALGQLSAAPVATSLPIPQSTPTQAPAAGSAKFCGNCGTSRTSGAKFCGNCGNSLA